MSLQAKATYVAKTAKNFFLYGTDFRRRLFVSTKQVLGYKELAVRRRVAREYAGDALFSIPRDKGYLVFPTDYFTQTQRVVEATNALVEQRRAREDWDLNKEQRRRDFLDKSTLTLDSPFMKFGLNPGLLASIARYLGMVPLLNEVVVWYSRSDPDGFSKSQLYHCDWDGLTQIKVFVYATDVDEAGGPLTIMDAQTSQTVRGKLKYLYGGQRYRVTDEEMEQVTGGYHEDVLVGPAGLVTVADTSSCFHYGSRVLEGSKPRVVAVFQYISPFSLSLSEKYVESRPFKHLATAEMSPLQRLILGA